MAGWRARLVAVGGVSLVSLATLLVPASPASAFTVTGPGGATPTPVTSSVDRTVSAKAKASQTYRATIPLSEWVAAKHAKAVAERESHNNCKAVSSGGTYRGKWQMGASFWKANGGKAYASRADLATCAEQDKVAYRGWVASWWHPWGG